jgi:nucleotide-binding universal stress UspA family protein
VALAERIDARLAALVTVELPRPVPYEFGPMPGETLAAMYSDARSAGARRAEQARKRLERSTVTTEVRMAEQIWPAGLVPQVMHAHYADLVVMAGPASDAYAPRLASLFGEVLIGSGRPVLVVPPGYPVRPAVRRAVIAWRPTREAARAVHDALPLLATAERIEVVCIDPQTGESEHGDAPGSDIAAHLARHGLHVAVIDRFSGGAGVASTILAQAVEGAADLVVAGGYGHSRVRERVIGGTTRDLLFAAHVPVLFSH